MCIYIYMYTFIYVSELIYMRLYIRVSAQVHVRTALNEYRVCTRRYTPLLAWSKFSQILQTPQASELWAHDSIFVKASSQNDPRLEILGNISTTLKIVLSWNTKHHEKTERHTSPTAFGLLRERTSWLSTKEGFCKPQPWPINLHVTSNPEPKTGPHEPWFYAVATTEIALISFHQNAILRKPYYKPWFISLRRKQCFRGLGRPGSRPGPASPWSKTSYVLVGGRQCKQPGKPAAYRCGILSVSYAPLWGIMAHDWLGNRLGNVFQGLLSTSWLTVM